MATRRVSALGPLAVAIVAAVEADAPLSALLASPGIWNTEAPQGSNLPYLILGFSSENPDNVFAAPGVGSSQQIDIWTRRLTVAGGTIAHLGNEKLMAIWNQLYGVLHEQPLAIEGFRTVIGTLSLTATIVDPDGESLHGICQYEVIARQA